MSGHYKMERGWQDHDLFDGDEYSRRDAWEWLIANACWRETNRRFGGQLVHLKRGQLYYSIRFLAEKWGWSKSRVARFLEQLKIETMIDTESGTGQILITVLNYDSYQLCDDDSGTEGETVTGTAAGQQRDKEEEKKEDIYSDTNVSSYIPDTPKKEQKYPEAFERFWFAYPVYRRKEKPSAFTAWKLACRSTTPENLMDSLMRYTLTREVAEGFAPYPKKWLRMERWSEEHIEQEHGKPSHKSKFDLAREGIARARAKRQPPGEG